MSANIRIVVETIARLAAFAAGLLFLPVLGYYWVHALWIVAFAGGASELIAVAIFGVGIVSAIFFLFLLWWIDRRIAGAFDWLATRPEPRNSA